MTEKSFIKEKVASLFVDVAKREWPGIWDNMDTFLRGMFFKDVSNRSSRGRKRISNANMCVGVFANELTNEHPSAMLLTGDNKGDGTVHIKVAL